MRILSRVPFTGLRGRTLRGPSQARSCAGAAVLILTLLTNAAFAQRVRPAAPLLSGAHHASDSGGGGDTRTNLRVIVSLKERRMWVTAGQDTLRAAPVAVASGAILAYAGRTWRFDSPRGRLQVLAKRVDPVWLPPDWHYAEVAREHSLRLRQLPITGATLKDGRRLEVRDSVVGVVFPDDSAFAELPVDEHVIFDSTLFIPPLGTRNRHITGELGRYALDLGHGFLLHGTNDNDSIGTASTHGCIRLADEDIEWLYENVPLGATVILR